MYDDSSSGQVSLDTSDLDRARTTGPALPSDPRRAEPGNIMGATGIPHRKTPRQIEFGGVSSWRRRNLLSALRDPARRQDGPDPAVPGHRTDPARSLLRLAGQHPHQRPLAGQSHQPALCQNHRPGAARGIADHIVGDRGVALNRQVTFPNRSIHLPRPPAAGTSFSPFPQASEILWGRLGGRSPEQHWDRFP